jgi:predicted type IV restriction endonuclease
MEQLALPPIAARLRRSPSAVEIYDRLRCRYVALTPEEWVRQHFVGYLIDHKGYPAGLMANEVSLKLNGTSRRCDTLVVDRHGDPLVIVEYKAPGVRVTQRVFDQIVRYNMVLRARVLIVSNGLRHYCCEVDYEANSFKFLPEVPAYDSIVNV